MKLLSVIGARPQFVKVAMIADAVKRHNRRVNSYGRRIRHTLVHTGQHYDHSMSGTFFDQLALPHPDHYLGVGSGPQGAQTGAMLERIEKVLLAEKPDSVMVYGDTNSTVAGALAATKLHIRLAHLEAGLRSFNRNMPEEINRVASDHISDVLFCPTQTAVRNLRREGITRNVFETGDVMLDAVIQYRGRASKRKKLLKTLRVEENEYALVTIHRAGNTDSPEHLSQLLETLAGLKRPIVFPMHPRVRDRLRKNPKLGQVSRLLQASKNLRIIEPVPYLDMLFLEMNARLILTDSGGVQKEAFFAAVPCLTLREETEWRETQQDGWNRIVGAEQDKIRNGFEDVWSQDPKRNGHKPNWKVFGEGQAADRTVAVLGELVN